MSFLKIFLAVFLACIAAYAAIRSFYSIKEQRAISEYTRAQALINSETINDLVRKCGPPLVDDGKEIIGPRRIAYRAAEFHFTETPTGSGEWENLGAWDSPGTRQLDPIQVLRDMPCLENK